MSVRAYQTVSRPLAPLPGRAHTTESAVVSDPLVGWPPWVHAGSAHHPPTLRRTWHSLDEVMAPGALSPVVKEMLYVATRDGNSGGHEGGARAPWPPDPI